MPFHLSGRVHCVSLLQAASHRFHHSLVMHNRLIAFLLCLGLGSAAQPTVPIPFDDVYNFTFSPGQNARQVLSVLGNDYSPGGGTLEVTGITGITPPRAGTVIARATDVLYQVSSFDGSASTDYFQ